MSKNVIYADTLLPSIIQTGAELLEVFAVSVAYTVLLVALYKEQEIKRIFAIFICATVYKYTLNTAVSWAIEGNIPLTWVWDALNVVYYTALEFLQLTIIYVAVNGVISRFTDRQNIIKRAIGKVGDSEYQEIPEAYPFKKLYDKSNCLLRSAFICALVTFIAKLLGHVLTDVWYIVSTGMPTMPRTWILMLLNYMSKAIFGVLVYFIVYSMFTVFLRRPSDNRT